MGSCKNRHWWSFWRRYHTWESRIVKRVKGLPKDKLGYLRYKCKECGHTKYYARGW